MARGGAGALGQYAGVTATRADVDVIAEAPHSVWADATWRHEGADDERMLYQLVHDGADWRIAVLTPWSCSAVVGIDRGDGGVIDWLLGADGAGAPSAEPADPAIRWQVLQDLLDAEPDAVAAERSRVAREGAGARILAARDAGGGWAGGAHFPKAQPEGAGQPWTSTAHALTELRLLGVDPRDPAVQEAIADVDRTVLWE